MVGLSGLVTSFAFVYGPTIQNLFSVVNTFFHEKSVYCFMEENQEVVSCLIVKKIPLPLMPFYDMVTSAQLVPMSVPALRSYLSAHRAEFPPPVYRRDKQMRRYRLLSAMDIRKVRAAVLRGPGRDHYLKLYFDPEDETK